MLFITFRSYRGLKDVISFKSKFGCPIADLQPTNSQKSTFKIGTVREYHSNLEVVYSKLSVA